MGDMLSQSEINALLGGLDADASSEAVSDDSMLKVNEVDEIEGFLDSNQKDVLGEIGNISMGTSATTLFALLNQKVLITTPKVKVVNWKKLAESYDRPCVGVRVDYKEGITGSNILVLKKRDVKIIADLMMGGEGDVAEDELSELDLSAIAEAMNQMVGSSSTSLSSMLNMKIDIDTPQAFELTFTEDDVGEKLGIEDEQVVCVIFKMEIGDLIDSEIMQIFPVQFAKDMVARLESGAMLDEPEPEPEPQAAPPAPEPQMQQPGPGAQMQQPMMGPQMQYQQPMMPQMQYQQPMMPQMQYQQPVQNNVNVQPAQFQSFDIGSVMQQKENIGIVMNVPLEVTVELGKTTKKIKEILEFSPGTIIELDKIAGEPIDIFVNGKYIARGEVVVIDENFGVRITDIINAEDRI